MTSDNHPQTEALRNQLFSTISHCFRRVPVTKQVDGPRRQTVGRTWWHQESVPAVADYLATTWHACRYDRESGKSCLEQRSGHALTMLRRERKYVGQLEQRGYIWSRSGRHDIGRMPVDLGLRDRKRPLAFARSDQEEANVGASPVDQRRRLEERGNAFSARHSRDGDDDRGSAETKLSAKPLCGRGRGQGASEPFDIDPTTPGRDHEAIFSCHPVAFEKVAILVGLEHGGVGRSSCRTIRCAINRASR